MPRPFKEYPQFADKNRRSAEDMRTSITRMHDGTWGTTIFWDGFFQSLTRDELMMLAGLLVHDLDELDIRNKQPRMPRKITRSYQEREKQE